MSRSFITRRAVRSEHLRPVNFADRIRVGRGRALCGLVMSIGTSPALFPVGVHSRDRASGLQGRMRFNSSRRRPSLHVGVVYSYQSDAKLNFRGSLSPRSSIGTLVQPSKQASCRFTESFEVLPCLASHGSNTSEGIVAWRAKNVSKRCNQ